jgi:periplasmic protein TonB
MTARASGKLPVAIAAALVINLLMFTAIELMIGMGRVRLTPASDFEIANFIRMADESREVRSKRDPKAPEKPQQEMEKEIEQLAASATTGKGTVAFSVSMPDVDIDLSGGIQIARELTPLVRIPADYPIPALMKGIEGFVELRFTVTETGSVANPEVLRADPPGVFERAAMRAVLKWKYQPQLVDGKPTAVITYTRLRFVIEEAQKQQ